MKPALRLELNPTAIQQAKVRNLFIFLTVVLVYFLFLFSDKVGYNGGGKSRTYIFVA